uniref:Uncharacterized protein n=1 Tax=Physcomitrium patens TaxID=3218 RepID=A0A2K1JUI3_PHYPA|nr:hypothetical protein PHYPA_014962 [Physcomitrium patens]
MHCNDSKTYSHGNDSKKAILIFFRTLLEIWICGVDSNCENDGDAGYRSPHLSHAKRALYHLSYIPGFH